MTAIPAEFSMAQAVPRIWNQIKPRPIGEVWWFDGNKVDSWRRAETRRSFSRFYCSECDAAMLFKFGYDLGCPGSRLRSGPGVVAHPGQAVINRLSHRSCHRHARPRPCTALPADHGRTPPRPVSATIQGCAPRTWIASSGAAPPSTDAYTVGGSSPVASRQDATCGVGATAESRQRPLGLPRSTTGTSHRLLPGVVRCPS